MLDRPKETMKPLPQLHPPLPQVGKYYIKFFLLYSVAEIYIKYKNIKF